jgi:hypothetical protein
MIRHTSRTAYACIALAMAAASLNCRPDICQEARNVDVHFRGDCLGSIVYEQDVKDLLIRPNPKCPWERLVNLSVFSGFRPGMTIAEARREFGPPESEVKLGGDHLWLYRRPKGAVQIGHEDQGSGLPFMYWWTLRFIPDNGALELFFSTEVAQRLDQYRIKKVNEIFVLDQCGLPMIVATVQDAKLKQVSWTNNKDSYHPERLGWDSHF